MGTDTPRHRAVVDCGSNSTRLWLATDDLPLRQEEITRLGRGVDATGRLDDQRLAHCLAVVERYAGEWRDAGIPDGEVVVIATSAVRDAQDRDRFFDGVRRVAGVDARVLAGQDEAWASFVGATTALDVPSPTLVVDIGGGSTELVVEADPPRATSLQLGTVRLTERHLHDDPPTTEEVDEARREAGAVLSSGLATIDVEVDSAEAAVASLVAVAGTATTVAALHAGSDDLDDVHDRRIPADDLADLAEALLTRPAVRRHELGPLASGRADVIAAGGLILATLVDLLAVDEVAVSVADVLDGVAFGALDT